MLTVKHLRDLNARTIQIWCRRIVVVRQHNPSSRFVKSRAMRVNSQNDGRRKASICGVHVFADLRNTLCVKRPLYSEICLNISGFFLEAPDVGESNLTELLPRDGGDEEVTNWLGNLDAIKLKRVRLVDSRKLFHHEPCPFEGACESWRRLN
ncbi:hypothetical protein RA210_U280028 [Rubrivivax sp. A210]|nr:hypothetical protein RA210_U280028 [Rubrivivax sp. A210]